MASNRPEDRTLTLSTSIAQNEVRIGVLDCGVGLPDDVETLFQPFHTTKADGLGMAFRLFASVPNSVFQTLLYLRLRRLVPLTIAHALMDGASVLIGVFLPLVRA